MIAEIPWDQFPESLRPGLKRYVEDGIRPGGFLLSLLENQLMEAAARADEVNRPLIGDLALLIVHHFPGNSFGSPEIVTAYVEQIADSRPDSEKPA